MGNLINIFFPILIAISLIYTSNILFKFLANLALQSSYFNHATGLFFAQIFKLLYFIIGLYLCFKFLPVPPKVFITIISATVAINFLKSLLKLLL